jgi:nucleotide-binding universal stress UspA family protein
MIGVVIVPLDGSELAEQVLLYAKRIADRLRIPIHLLRVIPPDASAAMRDDASSYLPKTVGELNYPGHISVRLGNTAEQIIALAGEVDNPIIAMTTHGRGGLGRLLYGSVADQALREANCPVLLIRSGTGPAAEEASRSIMVPLDGSAHVETVLSYALELAGAFAADLWLVRAVETPLVIGDPLWALSLNEGYPRMLREAGSYLGTMAERLDSAGVRMRTRVLKGFAEDEILEFGEESKVDLVVMATRGQTGVERLTLRDLAGHLLRPGRTPVLMVRTAALVAAENPQVVTR